MGSHWTVHELTRQDEHNQGYYGLPFLDFACVEVNHLGAAAGAGRQHVQCRCWAVYANATDPAAGKCSPREPMHVSNLKSAYSKDTWDGS